MLLVQVKLPENTRTDRDPEKVVDTLPQQYVNRETHLILVCTLKEPGGGSRKPPDDRSSR